MTKSNLQLFKERLREILKHDLKLSMLPACLILYGSIRTLQHLGFHAEAIKISSFVFRTSWVGSKTIGNKVATFYLNQRIDILSSVCSKKIKTLEIDSRSEQFFTNPSQLIKGNIRVLKTATPNEKGAIVIKYSNYFLLILKLFDIEKIQAKYNIILEPSWAGYVELSLFAYSLLPEPVFVQTFEEQDRRLLESATEKLIPISIGPSWFVNYKHFESPPNTAKEYDIVMVASWALFKRHHYFFKALAQLKKKSIRFNVALVGYQTQFSSKYINELAVLHGIRNQITIYDRIPPRQVANVLSKSKVNIIWSRFEGTNRSIIEGMFCGTPAILREGFNFGEKYHYINAKTGKFANEKNLADVMLEMVNDCDSFSPRDYVMQNMTCHHAAKILSEELKTYEISQGRYWSKNLVAKTNELDEMKYLDEQLEQVFSVDHEYLKSNLK